MEQSGGVLSECTSHLGEYAANRGLSRMPQILGKPVRVEGLNGLG